MGGSDVSPTVALRLALAGAWHAVRGRSLGQFPRVLGLLDAVGRAAPGAVRYRHGARLRLGLQAAVVMQMLREAQPDGKVLDAVDSFFPEGEAPGAGHGHASPRDLAMVAEAQESFRELVLALLGDRGRRAAYLQCLAGRGGPRVRRALPAGPRAPALRVPAAAGGRPAPPRPAPAAGGRPAPRPAGAPPPGPANPEPLPGRHGLRPLRPFAPPLELRPAAASPDAWVPPPGAAPPGPIPPRAPEAPPPPGSAPGLRR
ncbi:TERF1-interacting nuclear factor 2 isoform X5 [Rhea pennata]|uniref:TERF1-interacting nuclear factor 2 isoform X5 n=1 Tax=Rhea pennata TaxID=8795 RepID=UPI002E25DB82